jgi:hypothetical protein
MTILVPVAAFVLGVVLASVVNAAQIGHSEGRMQFQIGELRKSIVALHSVVTNLNARVERLDSD